MIIVTGGAGFIGSNLVKGLNERGRTDVLAVDDLRGGVPLDALAGCETLDVVDKDALLVNPPGRIEAVFHQGACSNTMEWNSEYMLGVNFEYSKALLRLCLERRVPFIYASSASIYGAGPVFREETRFENPLNLYAYSKFLFDHHVRIQLKRVDAQIVGLRYFNVYGPRESHKGEMASVAYKFDRQLRETGRVELFEGSDGYAGGEQERDFIWVGDAVAVNLFFLDQPRSKGIFNVGTGRAQSFNEVARAVVAYHGEGQIVYVPFPKDLEGRYQSYTQADIGALREAGYTAPFLTVEEGVPRYLRWLDSSD